MAGGSVGAFSPRTLREQQFNEAARPRIMEGFAFEDQDRERQAAEAKAAMDRATGQARIADINSRIRSRTAASDLSRRKFDFESGKPVNVPPGTMVFDPKTRQLIFTAPQREVEPPRGVSAELNALDQMKRDAKEAWRQVTQPILGKGVEDTPADKIERQRLATEAQARYNQAARRFGEMYGKWFEVGGTEGPNTWAYVKRREGQARSPKRSAPAKPRGLRSQPTANLRDLESR